jgi:undecaprenyl-diphosphatase
VTDARGWRWWLIFAAVAGIAVAISFLLDPAVEAWMREHQSRGAKEAMRWVSYIGDWPGHAVGAVAAMFIAYRLGSRRWVSVCVAILVALTIAGAVTRVVKVAAGRARPSVELDAGFNGPRFSAKYHAFPSGHTASSFACFGVLAFANRRLFAALLPIPMLIGFSRMYLVAHHFSDVVAGAALGLAVAAWVAHWRWFVSRGVVPARS